MRAMFLTKMKTAIVVIATVLGLGAGVGLMTGVSGNAVEAQEDKGKPLPTEAAEVKLQGEWQLETLVVRGSALGQDQVKGRTLVIEGNTIRHTAWGRDLERGTVALDPAKKPPTIDQTFDKGGSLGGMTLKGVYRVDGDTLTICNGPLGKDRPSDLVSKPGSGDSLFVYRRAKRDGKPAPLPEAPPFGQEARGAPPALLKARLDAAQKAYCVALKGSWSLAYVERDGKKTAVGSAGTTTLNPLTMAFAGTKFHITHPGEPWEVSGTYTLVANQKTAALDFLVSRDTTGSQVGEGRTDKYLCQVEGDTLKLASYGLGYHLRPKSFQD